MLNDILRYSGYFSVKELISIMEEYYSVLFHIKLRGDGMSYRINYRNTTKKEEHFSRFLFLTGVFFMVFLFWVNRYWPKGAAVLNSGYLFVKEKMAESIWNRSAEEMMTAQTAAAAFSGFLRNLLA